MDSIVSNSLILARNDFRYFKRTSISSILLLLSGLIATFVCVLSFEKNGYEFLFLLPLAFCFILLFNFNNFSIKASNFGFILVVGVEFIRLVVAPVLFVIGGYPVTVYLNAGENAIFGILLLVYEAIWIAVALKKPIRSNNTKSEDHSVRRIVVALIIVSAITAFICYMAPEILGNYRTIFQLKEEEFTTIEQGYIVNLYSGSFVKKLFLVLANYWLKPMRLIIPAMLMVILKKVLKKHSKLMCLALALTPLLFVDGTVARSLYFTLILLLFFNQLFDIKTKYMLYLLIGVAVFVVAYWYIRFSLKPRNENFLAFLAEKFNDYFSGFNVVSGVCNLPFNIGYSFKYLCDDIIHSIPFSNTLFGLDAGDTSRTFFNYYNQTSGGQVAATIAMGSYYATPVFAPIFSYLFVRLSIIFGQKSTTNKKSISFVPCCLAALYFALGIGVNDIGVTFGNYVQVILIIQVLLLFCRKKVKE